MPLNTLLTEIRACTHCKAHLPLGPRPVLRAAKTAKLLIVGQAPGTKVHESGIPWNDASGIRLRQWLGITPEQFYNEANIAIIPMGFCYPGKGKSGDLPPRPECSRLWHDKLLAELPDLKLTLLIGQYAHARYLGDQRKPTLTETVAAWRKYVPQGFFPLVHPSPRNRFWLAKNPWFDAEVVPALRQKIEGLFPG